MAVTIVTEVVKAGWVQTVPTAPGTIAFLVTSGNDVTELEFGNFDLFDITGLKFFDANINGQKEFEEPVLEGWTIELYLDVSDDGIADPGELVATTVTDQFGQFSFLNVGPGVVGGVVYDYLVREVQQLGWFQTTPNPAPIVPVSGGDVSGLLFGNFLPQSEGRTIGFWRNKNGQALIGEDDLLALRNLNLLNEDNSPFDPTTAAELGEWLQNATATNMAYMLSAQLAAMKLNTLNGDNGQPFVNPADLLIVTNPDGSTRILSVAALMTEANTALGTMDPDANRPYFASLKDALDDANNNLNWLVPYTTLTTYGIESVFYDQPTNRLSGQPLLLATTASWHSNGTGSPSQPPEQKFMNVAETGEVVVNHTPTTVKLLRAYDSPVVFATMTSHNGANTSVVRILDVQSDQFTLKIDEAPDHNGIHVYETVSYIVLEAGVWELADGTKLEVGVLETSATVSKTNSSRWDSVEFQHDFAGTPVVLSQVQSDNNSAWVSTRQRLATADGFDVAMEQAEMVRGSHGGEFIGYMAVEAGTGTWDGRAFSAVSTGDAVDSNWTEVGLGGTLPDASLLASISTYNGRDSSHLRMRGLDDDSFEAFVAEDTVYDSEVKHVAETIDFFAIEGSGLLTAQGVPTVSALAEAAPVVTIPVVDPAAVEFAEVGQVEVNHEPVTVELLRAFSDPVVFASMITRNGKAPSVVRVLD
ncbi:MAG: hypothetical protein ACYS8X_04270, partial [Planctomycetota bacterium]